jgi:hypothetical protein
MGLPILLMGKSGSGKSTSLRNFKKALVINVNHKPLPFKSNENIKTFDSDDYAVIKKALLQASEKGFTSVVIDDAGYLMTSAFMRGHGQGKGNAIFELYNTLADNFYDLIQFIIKQTPANLIAYVVMHEDKNDMGDIKPKTIGRMLDEKVVIEGLFTIVLRSLKLDGKYLFSTNTDGFDVTKTPVDMFEEQYITNDLAAVDVVVRKYYGLNNQESKE